LLLCCSVFNCRYPSSLFLPQALSLRLPSSSFLRHSAWLLRVAYSGVKKPFSKRHPLNDHEYQWVIDMLKGDIVENGFSTDSSGKIKLINMITFWLVLGGWKRVKSMQEQLAPSKCVLSLF